MFALSLLEVLNFMLEPSSILHRPSILQDSICSTGLGELMKFTDLDVFCTMFLQRE
jgi:hypothetical protein